MDTEAQSPRVVCMTCSTFLRGDPASPVITHAICPTCRASYLASLHSLASNVTTAARDDDSDRANRDPQSRATEPPVTAATR
jgi:hypothetical protein